MNELLQSKNECKWESVCPYTCNEYCMGHKCVCGAKEQMDYYYSRAFSDLERAIILNCFSKSLLTFYGVYYMMPIEKIMKNKSFKIIDSNNCESCYFNNHPNIICSHCIKDRTYIHEDDRDSQGNLIFSSGFNKNALIIDLSNIKENKELIFEKIQEKAFGKGFGWYDYPSPKDIKKGDFFNYLALIENGKILAYEDFCPIDNFKYLSIVDALNGNYEEKK